MKPFNLEEALAGEPVMLRNGQKAWVVCDTRTLPLLAKTEHPINVITVHGSLHTTLPDGSFSSVIKFHSLDIVGMWEEPKPTIKIGDIDVPEPEREPLKIGETYYIPYLSHQDNINSLCWGNDMYDIRVLKRGLVHRTKEAAIQHAKVLIAISQGKTSLEE